MTSRLTGRRLAALLPLLALVAGLGLSCRDRPLPTEPVPPVPPPPPMTAERALVPVDDAALPALLDRGDRGALLAAVAESRDWYRGRPADRVFVFGPRQATAAELASAMGELHDLLATDPSAEALAQAVRERFEVLAAVGGEDGSVLFTGYYEPVVAGSLERSPEFPVPVYGPPAGMVQVDLGDFSSELAGRRLVGRVEGDRLLPLPTRAEARASGAFRGHEIAWAADAIDLFFVEIQGSGALRLPDGRELRIGYAAANGRPYRPIGRLLVDEGHLDLETVSMQSIRAWLEANPEELHRVLDYNESMVFFRRLEGPPVGNLGVPVTPRRSIAVDQSLFPAGALAWVETELPAPDLGAQGRSLTGFVLAQDTGGAIRGPGRADFFWGRGEEAREMAGRMKQPGRLFFFVPRPVPGSAADGRR